MCVNVWTASSDGDIKSVKSFLASGGDVDAKDENGYTPLQAAVSYNHMELVHILLASGADINHRDIDLETPLHRCETVECAKLLLDQGADMNARNADGQTPFDFAIDGEFEELKTLYENLGAIKSGKVPKVDGERTPISSGLDD